VNQFKSTADRLCRIRSAGSTQLSDETFPLDDGGFLASEDVHRAWMIDGGLISPNVAAAESAVFVLLGEPGIGKSSTFRRIVDDPDELIDSNSLIWVDGPDLDSASFDDLLGTRLSELPHRHVGHSAAERGQPLVVILDQVDESPLLRGLGSRLARCLADRDTRGVRLLLACRTSDFLTSLHRKLTEIFGSVVVADLAPLTRAAAQDLVSGEGLDGKAFLERVVAVGAGPLASTPLTLWLLVKQYQIGGGLAGTPLELFTRGTEQLAEEWNAERGHRSARFASTVQRVAIAGRLAALTVLSGRRSIYRGADIASSLDYQLSHLAGGHELTQDGREFEVTEPMISETIQSSLFVSYASQRFGFRHSSITAFLAARYLLAHQVGTAQLKSMLLVESPDQESRTIPAPLRETAAWLLSLSPDGVLWLADADPASIAAHSSVVDSRAVRRAVAISLMKHAPEIELTDRSWRWTRWNLAHDGLDEVLRPALTRIAETSEQTWDVQARAVLALKVSTEIAMPTLIVEILSIVDGIGGARGYLRSLAVRAAAHAGEATAMPHLLDLLEKMGDVAFRAKEDPDLTLTSTLLDVLWPDHLDAQSVVRHLGYKPATDMHVDFDWRVEEIIAEMPDADLDVLLIWATSQLDETPVFSADRLPDESPLAAMPARTDRPASTQPRRAENGLDDGIISALVARVMRSSNYGQHLKAISEVAIGRLSNYQTLDLPDELRLLDQLGAETAGSRTRRRDFAASLLAALRGPKLDRASAYHLIRGWQSPFRYKAPEPREDGSLPMDRSGLLDHTDFSWCIDVMTAAAEAQDEAWLNDSVLLAAAVFDPMAADNYELGWSSQRTPLWEHIRTHYDAIDLDSPIAAMLRAGHERQSRHVRSPEADAFASTMSQRLDAAVSGDTDAFWRLCWDMQFDPDTLRVTRPESDDLAAMPGGQALSPQEIELLHDAAELYLRSEHDHADEWLGLGREDKRAIAGYRALRLLHRRGRLSNFERWPEWSGAVVSVQAARSTEVDEMHAEIADLCALHAPPQFAVRVATAVRGELAAGRHPFEIRAAVVGVGMPLRYELLALLEEIELAIGNSPANAQPTDRRSQSDERASRAIPNAVEIPATDGAVSAAVWTWGEIVGMLDGAFHGEVVDTCLRTLGQDPDPTSAFQLLKDRAAQVLLKSSLRSHLSAVRDAYYGSPDAARLMIASSEYYVRAGDPGDLDEESLASLYQWLDELYPRNNDEPDRNGWVSPRRQAQQWRDSIPGQIANYGTPSAIAVLSALWRAAPENLTLRSALIAARRTHEVDKWAPLSDFEVEELLSDPARRLVRNEAELLDLVLAALAHVQDDLNQHGDLLWDRIPSRPGGGRAREASMDTWRPKPEAALSAYLHHNLKLRLAGRGLAINREVLIRPRDAYGAGDRTDLLLEAMLSGTGRALPGAYDGRIALVIEVKGSWNPGVLTQQETQLSDRYLPDSQTSTGVYVVGWYPLELWTATNDRRKSEARKLNEPETRASLQEQSAAIAQGKGQNISILLLDVIRPTPPVQPA
jgi:hypothetical protein